MKSLEELLKQDRITMEDAIDFGYEHDLYTRSNKDDHKMSFHITASEKAKSAGYVLDLYTLDLVKKEGFKEEEKKKDLINEEIEPITAKDAVLLIGIIILFTVIFPFISLIWLH